MGELRAPLKDPASMNKVRSIQGRFFISVSGLYNTHAHRCTYTHRHVLKEKAVGSRCGARQKSRIKVILTFTARLA